MYPIKSFGVVNETCVEIFVDFNVLLCNDVEAEDALSGARSWSEAKLCLTNFLINFATNTILCYSKKNLERVRHETDRPVI